MLCIPLLPIQATLPNLLFSRHFRFAGQHDTFFLILYKELYFRHIYARVAHAPTFEHRYESYYNYCNLFNFILNNSGPIDRELPNQWLWDIIDEFIYQFQSFSLFR